MALLVALIFLAAIGLASAALMHSALNTGRQARSARSQDLAWQAAQAALHACETRLQQAPAGLAILPAATPPHWTLWNRWSGATRWAVDVPEARVTAAPAAATAWLPQCLAEWEAVPAGVASVSVTARGFSPDYAETDGRVTAGAVVWLQSSLFASGTSVASAPLVVADRVWRPLLRPPTAPPITSP